MRDDEVLEEFAYVVERRGVGDLPVYFDPYTGSVATSFEYFMEKLGDNERDLKILNSIRDDMAKLGHKCQVDIKWAISLGAKAEKSKMSNHARLRLEAKLRS